MERIVEVLKDYWPLAAGGSAVGGGLLTRWFTHRKDMIAQLMIRVQHLEELGEREREKCDAQLGKLEAKLRHTNANFAAVMLALEMAPEKGPEIVARMKAIREGEHVAD